MKDNFTLMVQAIWGKKNDKKLDFNLPKPVVERIEFFGDQIDVGLTFTGAIRAIMAKESEIVELVKQRGFWLPVSDEFKEWRDSEPALNGLQERLVALYLMYGDGHELEESNNKD